MPPVVTLDHKVLGAGARLCRRRQPCRRPHADRVSHSARPPADCHDLRKGRAMDFRRAAGGVSRDDARRRARPSIRPLCAPANYNGEMAYAAATLHADAIRHGRVRSSRRTTSWLSEPCRRSSTSASAARPMFRSPASTTCRGVAWSGRASPPQLNRSRRSAGLRSNGSWSGSWVPTRRRATASSSPISSSAIPAPTFGAVRASRPDRRQMHRMPLRGRTPSRARWQVQ